MDYKEFEKALHDRTIPRNVKVTNSWGVYDAYKAIRKHQWYDIGRPLKEHEFYSIIRGINDLLAEDIANGKDVTFPSRMGGLELRKIQSDISIVDGKLKFKLIEALVSIVSTELIILYMIYILCLIPKKSFVIPCFQVFKNRVNNGL